MSESALYELHQKFGRLEVLTEQQYKQVHEWAKETFATQQQAIARLESKLNQLVKSTSPPLDAPD